MFGYVRPLVPEMKVAEYEMYRGIYCGLCREIGRTSGFLSRFALTYDIVLLCAVRMILEDVTPQFSPLRCPAHPLTKRSVLMPNSATRFTAAVFDTLVSEKIEDDRHDERGFAKIKPIVLSPLAAHMKRCAGKRLSDGVTEQADALLARLGELEEEKCPSADLTSDAFGELLAFLFSLGLDGEKKEIAGVFGRSVGKYIYICDALDDLPADAKKGRYNPLLFGWGEYALDKGKVSDIVADSVRTSVPLSLEALGKAAQKLSATHVLTPIVENIVYRGLQAELEKVLARE